MSCASTAVAVSSPAVAVSCIKDSMMQHRPQSVDIGKWCDESIQHEHITIRGGFDGKGELAEAIQYKCADNVTHTFVALHKEARWFVKDVGGQKRGDLKAIQVFHLIHQLASAAESVGRDEEHCSAVVGSDSQNTGATDAPDEDPMETVISTESVADNLA